MRWSIETIKRLEAMEGYVRATRVDTLDAVVAVLEQAGIEFINPSNGGPGVRLRTPR